MAPMTNAEALVGELLGAVDSGEPAELEARYPPAVARALAAPARMLRLSFDQVRRSAHTVREDGEKIGALYRAVGEAAELGSITWPGRCLVRVRAGECIEVDLYEDPWAWRLQLGQAVQMHSDSVGGTWFGQTYELPFYLLLEQADGAEFTGVLETVGRRVDVAGSIAHPTVRMSSADGSFRFEGKWTGPETLSGWVDPLPEPVRVRRLPSWRNELPDWFDMRILAEHLKR